MDRQSVVFEEMNHIFLQNPTFNTALNRICEFACRLLNTEAASIMVPTPQTPELHIRGSHGLSEEYVRFVNLERRVLLDDSELSRGPSGKAGRYGLPVVIRHATLDDGLRPWTKSATEFPFGSMLSVPLNFRGELLGVLNTYSVRENHFRAEDISAFSFLGAQAAIVLGTLNDTENLQRTVDILREECDALTKEGNLRKRAATFHHELNDLSILGQGVKGIVDSLSKWMGKSVMLYDSGLVPLSSNAVQISESVRALLMRQAERHPERAPIRIEESTQTVTYVPLSVREQTVGYLCVDETSTQMDDEAYQLVDCASQALAMELAKQRAVAEAEVRIERHLLMDLIEYRSEEPFGASYRAKRLGLNTDREYKVILADVKNDGHGQRVNELMRYLRSVSGSNTRLAAQDSKVIILYTVDGTTHYEFLDELQRFFRNHAYEYNVGVGRAANLWNLPSSYDDALRALRVLEIYGSRDIVLDYDRMRLQRVILEASQPAILSKFANDLLSELLIYDEKNQSELGKTLIAYVHNNANVKNTATALFIHPNTVSYRLAKIQEICSVDLRNMDDLLSVELALAILHLNGVIQL